MKTAWLRHSREQSLLREHALSTPTANEEENAYHLFTGNENSREQSLLCASTQGARTANEESDADETFYCNDNEIDLMGWF